MDQPDLLFDTHALASMRRKGIAIIWYRSSLASLFFLQVHRQATDRVEDIRTLRC